jgi:hypothetical protein
MAAFATTNNERDTPVLLALSPEARKVIIWDMEDRLRRSKDHANEILAHLRLIRERLESLEQRTAELAAEIQSDSANSNPYADNCLHGE